MKKIALICAAVMLVSGVVATVRAADHVSKSTLSSMGFGKAQVLSDSDGMAVRGKFARASVSGWSTATLFTQHSSDRYSALSIHRSNALAVGGSLSVAGGASPFGFAVVGAGGFSFAYAR